MAIFKEKDYEQYRKDLSKEQVAALNIINDYKLTHGVYTNKDGEKIKVYSITVPFGAKTHWTNRAAPHEEWENRKQILQPQYSTSYATGSKCILLVQEFVPDKDGNNIGEELEPMTPQQFKKWLGLTAAKTEAPVRHKQHSPGYQPKMTPLQIKGAKDAAGNDAPIMPEANEPIPQADLGDDE